MPRKSFPGTSIDQAIQELRRQAALVERAERLLANVGDIDLKSAITWNLGRRTMSAAARRKIARAQKARWARVRAAAKKGGKSA